MENVQKQPLVSVLLPIMVPHPWMVALTECAINMLKATADWPIEIVVIEAASDHFKKRKDIVHVHQPHKTKLTTDLNAGIDAAKGEYLVHAANDIFPMPGWTSALLEPFFRFPDCGVSCLGAKEPGVIMGTREPMEVITEGMYGPFMMFPKGERFDEEFIGMHSDNDLIVRQYLKGKRSYRNNRCQVFHMDGITWKYGHSAEDRTRNMQLAYDLFAKRYAHSPLWIVQMILRGGIQFGREQERFEKR